MPNPDGTPLWNEPGFLSTLQQYQNAGGNMNRAAEFLYTGAGRTDPTQDGSTIEKRIRNMEAPPSQWQQNYNMERDQAFARDQLNSQAYNPGGANSYAISNNVGQNSGNPLGKYWWNNQWTNASPLAPALSTTNTNTNAPETRSGTTNTNNTSTSSNFRSGAKQPPRAFANSPQYSQFSNNLTPLNGLYNAQNLDQSLNTRPNTNYGRNMDFSRALWR